MALDASTSVTIGGVQCWDEGVPRESITLKGAEFQRTLVCAWSDRFSLYAALLGAGTEVNGSVETYHSPAAYPDAGGVWVTQVELAEAVGVRVPGAGMCGYEYARLNVTYSTSTIDEGATDGVDLGSVTLELGGDMLSLPQDRVTFIFKSDNKDVPPDVVPAMPITVMDVKYDRKLLPKLPIDVLASLCNTVNDDVAFGFGRGTLLYKGATTTRRVLPKGAAASLVKYDVTHVMKWRKNEWNKFLRPDTGEWDYIVRKGATSKYMFDYVSFDVLKVAL